MSDTHSTLLTGARKGKVRTDLHCHDCGGFFCAVIDYDIDGAHIVYCPNVRKDGSVCGHQHCRQIKRGVVTEDRWDGRTRRVDMTDVTIVQSQPAVTSTRSAFLRDRWLGGDD